MTLSPGARLGPYEILSALGAGGMGEVYRARDARLERDVAIKVLPPSFSADADRLTRFQQEARAAAALNHPNILAVFDLGEHEGAPFIVSELLEGSTLRDRIASGALAERKAAEYAIQIAQGLAAAHDRGIVHRDLKPENVFITSDGLVKILDFGLAKLTQPSGVAGGVTALPTTPALTGPGTVLGTLGYMAPEQIRGVTSDHRADIFAFGAVLYEMVSGTRAFTGATAADTMTAILTKDPPELTTSGVAVSPALDRVIRHCVEKAPDERFQSARDLIFALKNASTPSHSSGATQVIPAVRGRRLPWPVILSLTAAIVAAIVAAAALMTRQTPVPSAVQRLEVVTAGEAARNDYAQISLSPDGRHLAFVDSGRGRDRRIWLRALDSRYAEPIRGSEGGNQLFWSPDSQKLGYWEGDAIHNVDLPNGTPRRVAEAKGGIVGATWGDGFIVFSLLSDGTLYRVPAAGGTPAAIATPNQANGPRYMWPELIPGGRQLLYFQRAPTADDRGLWVLDLTTGAKVFVTRSSGGGKVLNDHLIYRDRDGTQLRAEPIDPQTFRLSGTSVPLADSILATSTSAWGGFSVSETGLLAVAHHAGTRYQLQWFERTGRLTAAVGAPSPSGAFSLEPRGERIVVATASQSALPELWLLSGASGDRVRLTFETATDPRWAAKGGGLLYFLQLRPLMPMSLTVGSARPATPVAGLGGVNRFSDETADGRLVLVSTVTPIGSLSIAPAGDLTKLRPLVRERFSVQQGRFSADGRWVAFTLNLPEGPEVFVQAVEGSERVRISVKGGFGAAWRADGRELYYESNNGRLMAVPVDTAAFDLRAGAPVELFAMRTQGLGFNQPRNVEPSADGQRFLVNSVVGDSDNAPIEMIVNWPALLKKN